MKVVIMFSAGIESWYMLLEALKQDLDIYLFTVVYDTTSFKEACITRMAAELFDLKYRIMRLEGYKDLKKGKVFHYRNYIFSLLAGAYAKSVDALEVWLGGEYMEIVDEFYDQYPQPYEQFINPLLGGVKVRLPLFEQRISRKEAMKVVLEKIDRSLLLSCVYGKGFNEDCRCFKHKMNRKLLEELEKQVISEKELK